MEYRLVSAVNDNPTETIPRFADNINSVECNEKSPKKPTALITVPIIIDYADPTFDIVKPEAGPY